MLEKLHISLVFTNLLVYKSLSSNQHMHNLYTKFVKILKTCKLFSENLVNELGNIPRRGPIPKFSDLEVVAFSLSAETESIDSAKWLFAYRLQEYKDKFPTLISCRQFQWSQKGCSRLMRRNTQAAGYENGRCGRTVLCGFQAHRSLPYRQGKVLQDGTDRWFFKGSWLWLLCFPEHLLFRV